MTLLFALGIIAVTIIDVLGSLSSIKLNYKYVYLTPISLLVYFLIGYQWHFIATLLWTMILVCLIGIYDGTIGWRLSIILKANFADQEERTKNLTISCRILGIVFVSGFFAFLGFLVADLI